MLDKALSITSKELREWFRSPFLIIISFAPILVISVVIGGFMTQAEVLPAGVIVQDNDRVARDLMDYLTDMQSGTGAKWFEMTKTTSLHEDVVLDKFNNGEILAYIIIPKNLTARLEVGEIIGVPTIINNINDDVTKNVMQRMELACNHINRQLFPQTSLQTIEVEIHGISPMDLTFLFYVVAAACSLAVVLPAGVNMATSVAREFEKNTIKHLIMGAAPRDVHVGKVIATTVQTIVGFLIILLFNGIIFGYRPKGNPFFILILVIWGALSFSGIGLIVSARIKQLLPAAIVLMILNIIGWWIGGGLVPPEIWSAGLKLIATFWPGTYFFRSFITLQLFGTVNTTMLLQDMGIVGGFGVLSHLIAYKIFEKEVAV